MHGRQRTRETSPMIAETTAEASEEIHAQQEIDAEKYSPGDERSDHIHGEAALTRSGGGVVLSMGMIGLSEHVVLSSVTSVSQWE